MGFATVSHLISISREELIKMVIDGEVVSCHNQNGDEVRILHVGNHLKGGYDRNHRANEHYFEAVIFFNGLSYGQAKLTFNTIDFQHYSGKVKYEMYPDDYLSE